MLGSFPRDQLEQTPEILLDVVIALCTVIVNHGLDSLQRELSRQVAVV